MARKYYLQLEKRFIYESYSRIFTVLDIRSYLALNDSYDAFIKAYECKLDKGFSPYDWFDDNDKINNTEFSPPEAFQDKMKNKAITDELRRRR